MAAERTGRPRGAPKKPIAGKSSRYWLAFAQAALDKAILFKLSERRTMAQLARIRRGEIRLIDGERLELGYGGVSRASAKPGAGKRHKDEFAPDAEDLSRELRRIRKRPRNHPDYRWLNSMGRAWRLVLEGDPADEWEARARATEAGEGVYFDRVMLPILRNHRSIEVLWILFNTSGRKNAEPYYLPHTGRENMCSLVGRQNEVRRP